MAEPKLLDQYRERLRVQHNSQRTEDAYLYWARRFIYFHGKRHPREMGGPEVEAFLKDVDFERREITVRDGKGGQDRSTMLPELLLEPLRTHLERVKVLHERDLSEGFGDGREIPLHGARSQDQDCLHSAETKARYDAETDTLFGSVLIRTSAGCLHHPRPLFDFRPQERGELLR